MADYYEMVSQVNQNISRGSFCLGAKYFLTLHAPEEKKKSECSLKMGQHLNISLFF